MKAFCLQTNFMLFSYLRKLNNSVSKTNYGTITLIEKITNVTENDSGNVILRSLFIIRIRTLG